MSTCGNCNCAGQTKKGNNYPVDIVETEISYMETAVVVDIPAAEHNGKCNCGPSCACVDCTCGQ